MAAAASVCSNPPFFTQKTTPASAFLSSNPSFQPFSGCNALKNLRPSHQIIPAVLTDDRRPPAAALVRCSLNSYDRPHYVPNRISEPNYVRIFDTTLRDGEQSPGATMTTKQKLDIARQLAKLGVDIIEAGFPASSEADLEAVRLIAREVGNSGGDHVPVICGLARCNARDIDKAWEAVKCAQKARIHTFIATSDIHMKHKLKKTKAEVVERARSMVAYARSLGCNDVEFSPEDAGR